MHTHPAISFSKVRTGYFMKLFCESASLIFPCNERRNYCIFFLLFVNIRNNTILSTNESEYIWEPCVEFLLYVIRIEPENVHSIRFSFRNFSFKYFAQRKTVRIWKLLLDNPEFLSVFLFGPVNSTKNV